MRQSNKPHSRTDLIKAIKPHYVGRLSDLREMSVARLREIYRRMSNAAWIRLSGRCE